VRRFPAFLLALIVAASVVSLVSQPIYAAPPAGSLDPTFGSGGKVTTGIDSGVALSVAVQADGKIVVGGQGNSGGPTGYDFTVVRYNTDGSLDSSFDGDGIAFTDIGDTVTERVLAIAVQSDGKIVALGLGGTPVSFAGVRYNTDGSLDTAFGGDGIVGYASAPVPVAMALQDDGKIVSVGGSGGLTLMRLNSDGSLDTSFDGDGMVTTDLGSLHAAAGGVVIQPGGKIVVAGGTDQVTSSQSDFVLARYLSSGVLDATFGGGGIVTTDPLGTGGIFEDVALDGDGKIVAVGRSAGAAALVRLNADGSLDTSFDGDGIALGEGASLAVQPDRRIVTAATDGSDWEVSRYNADGSPDTSFGTNGVVTTNGTFTYATDVELQPDGRILVVGAASDPVFAVARYERGNRPPVADAGSDQQVKWTAGGTSVTLDGSGSTDPDRDTLTYTWSGGFVGGTVVGAVATVVFDLPGVYEATLEVDDGNGDVDSDTVYIRMSNYQPVAIDDGPFAVTRDHTVRGNVLANDVDVDGDVLTAVKVSDPGHGAVTLASDGSFSYTAEQGYIGSDSFTYKANDGTIDSLAATVSFTVHPGRSDVGLVDTSTGQWRFASSAGPIAEFYYGNPGDVPFVGDWDCDGVATPGLFRQSDAYAYLRNSNTQGIADIRFFFGNPSDIPLAGDFNGDGCDTLSIYRPSEARFYIINKLGENEGGLGAAEYSFLFGDAGDKPVVGDWDGDGIDEIGLHRETTGFFYYRNTLTTGIADGQFYFGDPGDRFVAGDWGIVDGAETPALYRPSNTTFYFRYTLTQGNADSQFVWTGAGMNWLPVAGELAFD